jgi:hypothetical protein
VRLVNVLVQRRKTPLIYRGDRYAGCVPEVTISAEVDGIIRDVKSTRAVSFQEAGLAAIDDTDLVLAGPGCRRSEATR